MNRFKKEEQRKRQKAREGLSKDEIIALRLQEELEKRVDRLARQIHAEKFSEEYDFMCDDNVDAKDRKKGINPMSQEYIDKVQKKRIALGVTPLGNDGMAVSNDSFLMCLEEAKKIIYAGVLPPRI